MNHQITLDIITRFIKHDFLPELDFKIKERIKERNVCQAMPNIISNMFTKTLESTVQNNQSPRPLIQMQNQLREVQIVKTGSDKIQFQTNQILFKNISKSFKRVGIKKKQRKIQKPVEITYQQSQIIKLIQPIIEEDDCEVEIEKMRLMKKKMKMFQNQCLNRKLQNSQLKQNQIKENSKAIRSSKFYTYDFQAKIIQSNVKLSKVSLKKTEKIQNLKEENVKQIKQKLKQKSKDQDKDNEKDNCKVNPQIIAEKHKKRIVFDEFPQKNINQQNSMDRSIKPTFPFQKSKIQTLDFDNLKSGIKLTLFETKIIQNKDQSNSYILSKKSISKEGLVEKAYPSRLSTKTIVYNLEKQNSKRTSSKKCQTNFNSEENQSLKYIPLKNQAKFEFGVNSRQNSQKFFIVNSNLNQYKSEILSPKQKLKTIKVSSINRQKQFTLPNIMKNEQNSKSKHQILQNKSVRMDSVEIDPVLQNLLAKHSILNKQKYKRSSILSAFDDKKYTESSLEEDKSVDCKSRISEKKSINQYFKSYKYQFQHKINKCNSIKNNEFQNIPQSP